jgi:hypothetical protein
VNGHSTSFWGWGGEDDDLYLRVLSKLSKPITRYPNDVARYKMIRTHKRTSSEINHNRYRLLALQYDYDVDGINTTKYILNSKTFYKLFILINVTLTEEKFEQVYIRLLNNKTKS